MTEALVTALDHGGWPAICATLLLALSLILRELRSRRIAAERATVKVIPEPAPEARASRSSWPTRRVLVVEDNPMQARLVLMMLAEVQGAEVEAVANGEEALDRLRRDAFDLLIADMALPGMSGAELVRRVRAEGSMRPLVHAVLLSGQAAEALEAIARECGASAWLAKPLKRDAFLEVVGRLLDRQAPVE